MVGLTPSLILPTSQPTHLQFIGLYLWYILAIALAKLNIVIRQLYQQAPLWYMMAIFLQPKTKVNTFIVMLSHRSIPYKYYVKKKSSKSLATIYMFAGLYILTLYYFMGNNM